MENLRWVNWPTKFRPNLLEKYDDPAGHHVAALAPPRAPWAPQECEDRPEGPGAPRDEKTHRLMSAATPGLPEVSPERL